MEIYIVAGCCLALFSIFKRSRWPLLISFCILLFIGGLRDISVGTDSRNYETYFEQFSSDTSSLHHANEPLYLLIQFIALYKGWSFETIQFICMFIILLVVFYYVSLDSKNPNYSILCYFLLYFYFYSFNTTRQFLAIPFVLMTHHFISIKKRWLASLSLLIACMFHFISVIAVTLFFIDKIKASQKILTILLFFTFIIGAAGIPSIIMNTLSGYLGIFGEYANNEIGSRNSLFSFSRLLLNIYTIWLLFNLRDRNHELTLLTIGVCLLNFFSFNPSMARLAQYFTIFQIVIIPNIPLTIINKHKKSLLSVASFVYMFITWIYLLTANNGEVVPWKYGGMNIF